jgi:hypothetical protein
MLSSFKQMTPLLESIHDGKKFIMINFIINFSRRELTRTEVDKLKKNVFSKLWEYDT